MKDGGLCNVCFQYIYPLIQQKVEEGNGIKIITHDNILPV